MVNWFTFLKHIPIIGLNFLLDAWKGFYFLFLVDVETTKCIFMLAPFKSLWYTMIFHTWTPSFNFHILERLKLLVWIYLQMLSLEHMIIKIVIIGHIGQMFKFDNTNKMQWDLRFYIVVDYKDEWNIKVHMFNLKGGWLKCP
jgi:hypothetical protein